MYTGFLRFNSIPSIGFAHHFYAENFCHTYGTIKKSLEIVYVKSGGIEVELYDDTISVPEGSIFVLFRHLPLTVKSIKNSPQSHCTVQAAFDYDFSYTTDGSIPEEKGIILPFVTPPCKETENIKNELYSIVSDLRIAREENELSSSIRFLNIMQQLDTIARKNQPPRSAPSSIISYQTKKFVTENLHKNISLADIAIHLNKTSGYINHTFKEANGVTVIQYINKEKVQRITSLMHDKNLSFKDACSSVGITDISYGYRLFKKHMGITPGEFISGDMNIRE